MITGLRTDSTATNQNFNFFVRESPFVFFPPTRQLVCPTVQFRIHTTSSRGLHLSAQEGRELVLTMKAELISLVFLILMFVVLFCVVKMYLAVIVLCEQRTYPVQGPEMRGRLRTDPAIEDGRRAALGNRPAVNQVNQRTGRRAEPQEHDERLC